MEIALWQGNDFILILLVYRQHLDFYIRLIANINIAGAILLMQKAQRSAD